MSKTASPRAAKRPRQSRKDAAIVRRVLAITAESDKCMNAATPAQRAELEAAGRARIAQGAESPDPQPRRMWCRGANGTTVGLAYPDRAECAAFSDEDKRPVVPVAVIPLDDERSLIDRAFVALYHEDALRTPYLLGQARGVLEAVGVLTPAKRRKGVRK